VPDYHNDAVWMARALQLAARGLTTTTPNPRVGCVLVRDGVVVGEGFHQRAGEAHAEVHALAAAGDKARGATAYVTLEPCSHHGRTPPCADALIKAGVSRVVTAMQDPNPDVAGRGLARLEAAGIETQGGVLAADAEALNAGFLKRMRNGQPWLTLSQTDRDRLQNAGAQLKEIPDSDDGRLDLTAVIHWLGEQSYNEIWTEAGATLAASLLDGGWVDEVRLYQAPVFLGSAIRPLYATALSQLSDGQHFNVIERLSLGTDLCWRLRHHRRHSPGKTGHPDG